INGNVINHGLVEVSGQGATALDVATSLKFEPFRFQ
ncbi:hypothetical protein PSYAE_27323, partial [Pseudomonas amygdali pv. aesculi str. 0893_23]